MRAEVEIYRGIEFVRLSSLTQEQNKLIADSSISRKTIKILRGTELLTDCIPYQLYLEWYKHHYHHQAEPVPKLSIEIEKLKLALK